MPDRIKILWLCDVQGWAYYNRTVQLIERLPDYDHNVLYITGMDFDDIIKGFANYDVIISWFVSVYNKAYADRIITGLTGGRIQRQGLDRLINGNI